MVIEGTFQGAPCLFFLAGGEGLRKGVWQYKEHSEEELSCIDHGKFSLLLSLRWKLLKCLLGI